MQVNEFKEEIASLKASLENIRQEVCTTNQLLVFVIPLSGSRYLITSYTSNRKDSANKNASPPVKKCALSTVNR